MNDDASVVQSVKKQIRSLIKPIHGKNASGLVKQFDY